MAWGSEYYTVHGQSKAGLGKYFLIDPSEQDNWSWQFAWEILRSSKNNSVATTR